MKRNSVLATCSDVEQSCICLFGLLCCGLHGQGSKGQTEVKVMHYVEKRSLCRVIPMFPGFYIPQIFMALSRNMTKDPVFPWFYVSQLYIHITG